MPTTQTVQIDAFTPSDLEDFQRISYQWLSQYHLLEEEDIRILSHPQEVILDPGGRIFVARQHGHMVGTVSLIPAGEHTFELAKMVVVPQCRGHGLGKRLMEHAIHSAKLMGAKRIILYTNSRLKEALSLYRKYGFHEVKLSGLKYQMTDIAMVLSLD
nr:GNAT family N-acetyltransferase [uncultured Solibaculum sp.]